MRHDNKSIVGINVAGKSFTGWKSANISTSVDAVSTIFKLALRDKNNSFFDSISAEDFPTGFPCTIDVENTLLRGKKTIADGFIVRRKRTLSTESSLVVDGADKLVDILDCSAEQPSKTWRKVRFTRIIESLLKPYNIKLNKTKLLEDPLIEKFTLQSGEAIFDAVERLCRSQAVLPMSNFAGELELGYAATQTDRALVDLEYGVNVKSISEVEDWNERYSKYIAVSQYPGNGKRWTKEMLQGLATSYDVGVTRYRPKIIVAEQKSTKELLIKRVRWEAQVRAGRSVEYEATVRGFYQNDKNGYPLALWEKNKRTNVIVSKWNVQREMLIVDVTFSIDEAGGEITTMGLSHPDIYKPQPDEKVKLT